MFAMDFVTYKKRPKLFLYSSYPIRNPPSGSAKSGPFYFLIVNNIFLLFILHTPFADCYPIGKAHLKKKKKKL